MEESIEYLFAPTTTIQDNVSFIGTVICLSRGVISLVGIIGNSLTVRTFFAMGLKDGVTLSLFFLSISDLMYLIFATAASISYAFVCTELLTHLKTHFPVDPYSVEEYLAYCANEFYNFTMLTIIFLSVARCLSVAKPMWFRNTLGTKKASIIVMIITVSFTIATILPVFSLMAIIPQFDKKINATRPIFWTSPYWNSVTSVIWPIRGFFIILAVQLILVVCSLSMNFNLTKALKFRQQNTIPHTAISVTSGDRYIEKRTNHEVSSRQEMVKLSGKELIATQQMLVISVAFIVSNTPRVCFNTAIVIFYEYSFNGKFGKLFEVVDVSVHAFQCIFCCLNVFIYLKYNSRFRAFFWKTKLLAK